MRGCGALSLALIALLAATASAQPSDPYGAEASANVDEQVAVSLVARAQELLDEQMYADARQLALEALQTSAHGAAGAAARVIIRAASKQLAIPDAPLAGDPAPPPAPVVTSSPSGPPPSEQPEGRFHWPSEREWAAGVHGGLFVATLVAPLGWNACEGSSSPMVISVFSGLGGGIAAGLSAWAVKKTEFSTVQIRTVGSASVWAGAIGAFLGDAVYTDQTTGMQVLVGAAIGESVGALAGVGIVSQRRFTDGDIAMIDTFSGMGLVGGLTVGMLMQPAKGEAYSVNAALGTAAGFLTGYVAGPLSNTTPRRMARVAGGAAIGGAAPFLLYGLIHDSSSTADERVTGLLSSGGLVIGAYVAFRLTRGMDQGLDVLPASHDAPAALVGRSSDGQWAMGGLSVQPLSRALSTQNGYAVPLLSGAF
ncbi:hypothetical protein BH11MYX2_BH11MYX2_19930 [soil metagenome]